MFVEKTPNYSQELKEKREALGLSLADVFRRTRISVAYLQAIENNDFQLLPVSVYTKNFIRTYARALGVDSEPIIANYENYLNSRKSIQTQPPRNASEKKNVFARIASPKAYWSIASVLIVVSIVTWLISKQYQSSSDIIDSTGAITAAVSENKVQTVNPALNSVTTATPNQQAAAELEKNKINEQSQIKTQSIPAKIENNAAKPLKEQFSLPSKKVETAVNDKEAGLLVISAIEETWIRIKADQTPSFQILLKAGEKFERKAASFDMDIGNAGGIKIQFKGKKMENLGKSGQVVHLRLP
ncbi:transcriptional regulator, xre family [hydrocarbon metagenome]|uniref:Transcriptional regulator, xre family n=1 Tax=hydrocarbon metagenome TaxID=938273 RepID=A0A0W8FRN7_9ZZZZ